MADENQEKIRKETTQKVRENVRRTEKLRERLKHSDQRVTLTEEGPGHRGLRLSHSSED
jgi:hypothetical protein